MKNWIRLLGLFLVTIITLSGCSGGGGSEGTPASQSSINQGDGTTTEGTTGEERPPEGGPLDLTNSAPVAQAGIDQTIAAGIKVSLDGTRSNDPDGDSLSYQWTMTDRPSGSSATLSGFDTPNPSFTPDRPGDYTIQLVVIDGKGLNSLPDTVKISTINSAPVADAGPDQSFGAAGATIYLGGQSYDPDGDPISYSWNIAKKPSGSMAALSNPTSANPYFVADGRGDYTIELTVSDPWNASKKDTMEVRFSNARPVANAGGNTTVTFGQTVNLNGSGSFDANGDSLSYNWSFTFKPSGSGATLASPTSKTPSFTPDLIGTYVVSLIVSDGWENSTPSSVTVTVVQSASAATVKLQQAINLVNNLDESAFKNRNMRDALTNKFNAVIQTIDGGNISGALGQLENDILQKMNGCADNGAPDANDWIINCPAQGQIYPLVQEAIQILRSL